MKKQDVTAKEFLLHYADFKEENLNGRFVNDTSIENFLNNLKDPFQVKNEGFSVLKKRILSVTIGTGPIKILAWSQMHGNETTTTKAVFDIFNFLKLKNSAAASILNNCSLKVIPMLNPDGAERYTRENSNLVDLNRDAYNLTEPESKLLKRVFDAFKPDFCFNLHDQRTIYSAGSSEEPATLSFLAPSSNPERNITPARKDAMKVIAGISNQLSVFLNSKIGRYDDTYNLNCTGDTFMALDTPTILFEAGHFPKDYQREETRKFTAFAIYIALQLIATKKYEEINDKDYFGIPENQQLFYDVIIRNVKVENEAMDIGVQYREELAANTIRFIPIVQEIAPKINKFAHKEILGKGQSIFLKSEKPIEINTVISEFWIGDKILSIKTG